MSTTTLDKPNTSAPKAISKHVPKSRYGNINNQQRVDIPVRVRSGWEANVYRLLHWLQQGNRPRDRFFDFIVNTGVLIDFAHEDHTYFFPGSKTTGNAKYIRDFGMRVLHLAEPKKPIGKGNPGILISWVIEVKGRLPQGGLLQSVDLEQLRDKDDDSRIKLERLRKYYGPDATYTYLIGLHEYKELVRVYKNVIPHWE